MSHSSREVERMSQNVEELQWRIRNNYELPVEIVSPTSQRPTQLRFDRQVVTGLKVLIDVVLTTLNSQANKNRNGGDSCRPQAKSAGQLQSSSEQ